MQFWLFIVLTDAIYNVFSLLLSVYTQYLGPISLMQCFYGPVHFRTSVTLTLTLTNPTLTLTLRRETEVRKWTSTPPPWALTLHFIK